MQIISKKKINIILTNWNKKWIFQISKYQIFKDIINKWNLKEFQIKLIPNNRDKKLNKLWDKWPFGMFMIFN